MFSTSKMIASLMLAGAALTATGAAQAAPILQYANSVIGFSSQYNTTDWAATQVLGAPNRLTYGDIAGAWAPHAKNGTQEFISVGFGQSVYADGATIREVYGNGFVTRVDVIDTANVLHTVWSGTDPSLPGNPVDFTLSWDTTSFLVKGLKVYVNTNHNLGAWEEIDAIQLSGDSVAPAGEVPEPVSLGLLGIGLLGLAAARRKRAA